MKKQVTFCLLLLLLTVSVSTAQLQNYYNQTHRQIGLNAVSSTRLDTLIMHSYVLIDSLIRYVQLNGIRADAYSTLSAALDAANSASSRKYVTVNSSKSITADYTIPATVGLVVETGGTISVSSGVTLTIRGPFTAPPNQQVFSGSGTVIFDLGATPVYFSEWFGAKNDSTTDSGTAIKKTLDAMPNGGILQLLPTGLSLYAAKGYIVNTTIRVPPRKNLVIEGNGAVIYSSATDTVFLIQNGSQTTIPSYALSPTTIQPRHVFNSIRFKRITGYTGLGVAIALVNSTAQTFNDIDVADYNNAFVFHNISDGWCENNEIFNSRIAGCDTAIAYMLSQSGNNSMATNSLRKVTITRFTDSDVVNQGQSQAVGIFGDTGTNLYRNLWDQVVIFPKDSVTCVNIDGKAEDLTGTVNFEYIGSTNTTRMRGFHFGSSSSELRFKLHMNLTGRIYFDEPNIFYSEIPGTFGYSGITTTLDGNQNHGIEMVVDSSKFTPWFGVIKNSRLGMTTPADSGRILFGNFNNSGVNKLDIRGRRYGNNKASIDMRSLTDNVYSAATANSVDGSALPLLPVRLLDVGGNIRSIQDSTTIDVRNVTAMVIDNSSSTVPYTLSAFKGGVVGQTITATFASSKIYLANLRGTSGNGRLFLLSNDSTYAQSGMKSFFRCESESGGVFWREMWRSAEYEKTTDYTSTVDSIDVAQVNYIRFNRSVLGNIRNFYNGIDGQMITTLDRTGNSTYLHLGKGTTKGISLIGAASRRDSSGTRHIFVYDGQEDLWREISLSSNTNTGGGGWTDEGTNIKLETTTDNVTIGDNTNAGKLTIDGDANEVQLYIKGHSTQTSGHLNLVKSDGTNLILLGQDATTVAYLGMPSNGSIGIGGTQPSTLVNGLTIYNGTAGSTPTNGWSLYSISGEPIFKDGNGTVSNQVNAWGALYMSNATNVISTSGTAGTWVKVTGFTLESSPAGQGITAVADSFTVTVAGTYEINVSMSFHGGTASVDNYKIAMAKNAVANTNYQAAVTTADNSSIVNVHFTGYYSGASVGDDFSLLMTNNTDGDDPTIKQCMVTIKRIN